MRFKVGELKQLMGSDSIKINGVRLDKSLGHHILHAASIPTNFTLLI